MPQRTPRTPPKRASTTDSLRNWERTSERRAPTAFRIPISRVRSVTATSMMFMMTMPPTTSEIAATPTVVNAVVDALAAMEPMWEPGTRHGYHALVFGHLVGEVVRRVTGSSLGEFFRAEVAEPLGLDFWIGLPEEQEPRVATSISPEPPAPDQPLPPFYAVGLTDPTSIPGMIVWNSGGILMPGAVNARQVRAAEIPSANGITNARGLAGMYRPLALGGEFGGVRLVPEDAVPAMGAVSAAVARDATLLVPTRWANGFMKGVDNTYLPPGQGDAVILSEEAFGHLGNGGSLGFADPRARLSFGYAMNRQGGGTGLEDRGQALVDAVYRILGYRRGPRGGMWYV